ncbi:MAG: lauroyl acyltransferase [Alphaproteobacteria bacterium]|nr:lauroyl acyltransferase [Alphaproteobacteria bacterium]
MIKFKQIKKRVKKIIRAVVNHTICYPIQGILALVLCLLFRLIPIDLASALGGFLGRNLGPKLPVSWVARYNLVKVFPDKTPREIDEIVVKMWDNLMRTFFEYPHLRYLTTHYQDRIEFIGVERFEQMRDDNKAGILFSAHYGNWEVGSIVGRKVGMDLHRIYRSANNPYVEWMFRYFRLKIKGKLIDKRKKAEGLREIVAELRKGGHFALLIDQKFNKGIDVDFFGYSVKTVPSMVKLALKYNFPILPARVIRTKGAHFKFVVDDFFEIEKTGNEEFDIINNMTRAHHVVEKWILEKPEMWLWVHNRWPESKFVIKKIKKHKKEWRNNIISPEIRELTKLSLKGKYKKIKKYFKEKK